jgi:GNAT superfamily N-acetyltransferase
MINTNLKLNFEAQPAETDVEFLQQQYGAAHKAKYGSVDKDHIAVFVYGPATCENEPAPIIGGVYGTLSDSWLYIDLLWVDSSLRGQGYGVRLMQTIEQAAATRGINRAFLGTTTFQAPKFYQQLGYRVVGEMPFASNDYVQYIFAREPLTPYDLPPETELTVADSPKSSDVKALGDHLTEYNNQFLPFNPGVVGCVFLRDETGKIVGGVRGNQIFDSLLLPNLLWVADEWQGQGYEVQLLHELETVARTVNTNLKASAINTDDADAVEHFSAAGYTQVSKIADYPTGRNTYTLLKNPF